MLQRKAPAKLAKLRHYSLGATTVLMCLLACMICVALPGCSGCQEDPAAKAKREAEEELEAKRKKAEEAKKKKKEEPKEEFTVGNLLVEPNENTPGGAVKPGHWIGVSQLMQANKADFNGDVAWQSVDDQGRPLLISRAPNPFSLKMSRPVSLAFKQQTPKQIETSLFVPQAPGSIRFRGRLASSSLGMQWPLREEIYQVMAPHEYQMVVLSRDPRRYAFLKSLDSIAPPDGGDHPTGRSRYYYVLMPPANKPVPLSSQALTWTSIAYLIWDDMAADRLNEGQQRALLDWLHWGGQLIVSGPETLDTLRSSFLAPYLPAESAGTMTLTTEDLAKFSAAWTLRNPRGPGRELRAINPWSAVKLKPRSDVPGVKVLATSSADAPLVVEGRVGRGRMVVTSFHLAERELDNWPSFDHFFNACLLRRPPRIYSRAGEDNKLLVNWEDEHNQRLDPRRVTALRLFGRDGGYSYAAPPTNEEQRPTHVRFQHAPNPANPFGGNAPDSDELPPLGLGSWNDSAPVPDAARGVIRDAAGIEIPSSTFVMWVLAGYLLVLVPLNWVMFRLLGRIEWAWIAAPLIAIAGTALVVRLAQLDIGFVRSVTDVGVLETQPSYSRGHLTRFSALYTSLSTGYDFEFDEAAGLIQPFSTGDGRASVGQTPHELEFRRDDKAKLTGFHVLSNRADLVRSEQLIDLSGPIQLATGKEGGAAGTSATVDNRSTFALRHAIAVRRSSTADKWDVAWLGDIGAGSTATGTFEAVPRNELLNRWDELSSIKIGNAEKLLSLRRVLDKAITDDEIRPGDLKLFASIETPLAGLTVSPRSTQPRHLTLLVANLIHAAVPEPKKDRNTRQHFAIEPPRAPLEEESPQPGLLP
ncbi:MAG: hypothetical protein K8T91_27745 [Planctomycetes bacterium]|nr:hypothetical protein [Planctomycetota bacterium]